MDPRRWMPLLGYQTGYIVFPQGPPNSNLSPFKCVFNSNTISTLKAYQPGFRFFRLSENKAWKLGNEASSHWGGEGLGSVAGAHLLGLRGCPGGSSIVSYL